MRDYRNTRPMTASEFERFDAKVRRDRNGCWCWTSALDGSGYGLLNVEGSVRRAHRLSYAHFIGSIPNGICVLHDCPGGDNPACVNPDHLWLGTRGDNNTDRNRKGRSGVSKGSYNPNTALTEADVRVIRRRISHGERKRVVGNDYGLGKSAINRMIRGASWSHVPLVGA